MVSRRHLTLDGLSPAAFNNAAVMHIQEDLSHSKQAGATSIPLPVSETESRRTIAARGVSSLVDWIRGTPSAVSANLRSRLLEEMDL
jgi:hypothetical protein